MTFKIILIVIIIVTVLATSLALILTRRPKGKCKAPAKECAGACYDPNSQQCIDGVVRSICALPTLSCGTTCVDPKLQRCVNGAPQDICPKNNKLCGSTCYDPTTAVCSEDGSLRFRCGSDICPASQICGPKGTCVDPCVATEPLCDLDTLTSSTYCYFIGLQGPFKMFRKQRYYSADKNYYIALSKTTLAIYNASNVEINQIAGNLNTTDGSFVQFQEDSNICIYDRSTLLYCSDTFCVGCAAPQYNLIDGVLHIIRDGKTAREIGLPDPRGLLYIQPDGPALPAGSLNLNSPDALQYWSVYASDVATQNLAELFFYNWPVRSANILRIGDGKTGESWAVFDTSAIDGLDGAFSRSAKTGCIAKFYADTTPPVATMEFVSLDNILDIPDYSKAKVEPAGVLQDYLYYLFLRRNGRKYPYLRGSELDAGLLERGQLYKTLVISWLKYFSPEFRDVEQSRRFNKLPSSVGGTERMKRVRDYNINSEDGVSLCNAAPELCASLLDQLCSAEPSTFIPSTVKSDYDILDGVKTYGIHVESDTCRRYFQDSNTPEKATVISKYLQPVCKDASAKFADQTFRACCSHLKTAECERVNGLFTDDGNCSCYIQSADLEKLYGVSELLDASKVGISGTCYSDCLNHSQTYNANTSYNIQPCNSNICIISETADVDINNSQIGKTTINQYACCSNLSDKSCAPR